MFCRKPSGYGKQALGEQVLGRKRKTTLHKHERKLGFRLKQRKLWSQLQHTLQILLGNDKKNRSWSCSLVVSVPCIVGIAIQIELPVLLGYDVWLYFLLYCWHCKEDLHIMLNSVAKFPPSAFFPDINFFYFELYLENQLKNTCQTGSSDVWYQVKSQNRSITLVTKLHGKKAK